MESFAQRGFKMKTKFTPGPWYASKDDCCIYAKLQTTDGTHVEPLIAQCSKLTTSAKANAVLIAAAPEMFEVLQLIGTIANVSNELSEPDCKNRMIRIAEHVNNILNKAKGKE